MSGDTLLLVFSIALAAGGFIVAPFTGMMLDKYSSEANFWLIVACNIIYSAL